MLKTLVSTKDMNRDEWLYWRSKGIGGSDASIVCGVNRYKSPVELWMEKTGMIEPAEAGEASYWGTIMEPIIRKEFEKVSGFEVTTAQYIFQHPDYDFMLANIDGIVHHPVLGDCIFEAKTSSSYRADEWDDSIPEEYMMQVQHYMAVTGFPAAFIAVLIGGNTFKWKMVERDNELIEIMVLLEKNFWNHVTSNTPPPIDGSDASTDLLNRLYPSAFPKTLIMLPEEANELIVQYEEASEQEKKIAELKNEAANKLKQMLGTHETGMVGKRVISWKTISVERFDTKQFKNDHPDLYSKYIVQSGYRRFSLK
jgi:putative phage-type endonuclease